ncbi:MAG: hypothetical protein OXQ29_03000 [Rhodospirillaceae bacterium]|nr:hypothetical protein [Rhodospirillaceae bacterium]
MALPGARNTALSQERQEVNPILLIVDDEDGSTVKRSSKIAATLRSALTHHMNRTGLQAIDEETVIARLGWKLQDRLAKAELHRFIKLVRKSNRFSDVRAVVLLKLGMAMHRSKTGSVLAVRAGVELWDFSSHRLIDAFQMPPLEYRAASQCDASCVSDLLSHGTQKVAVGIGTVLARKLARHRSRSASRDYTVTFRHFHQQEVHAIVGVMAEELPGYKNHRLITNTPDMRSYAYVTSADPAKLEGWLTMLLGGMGLTPGKDVQILVETDRIEILRATRSNR